LKIGADFIDLAKAVSGRSSATRKKRVDGHANSHLGWLLKGVAAIAVALSGVVPAASGAASEAASTASNQSSCLGYCVTGGSSTLTLSAAWLRKLSTSGIKYEAIAPAVLHNNRLTLPIVRTPLDSRFSAGPSSWGTSETDSGEPCLSNYAVVNHRGGLAIIEHGTHYALNSLTYDGGAQTLDFNSVGSALRMPGGIAWRGLPPASLAPSGSAVRAKVALSGRQVSTNGASTFTLPPGASGSLVLNVRLGRGDSKSVPRRACAAAPGAPVVRKSRTFTYDVGIDFTFLNGDVPISWSASFRGVRLAVAQDGWIAIAGSAEVGAPGTLVGSIRFPGGHGYPSGRCAWTKQKPLRANLVVLGSWSELHWAVYPLPGWNFKRECGGWLFGATGFNLPSSYEAISGMRDGWSKIYIEGGVYSHPAAPLGLDVRIEFQDLQKPPTTFPYNRLYKGKNVAYQLTWSTIKMRSTPGKVRVTFTRRD